MSKRVSYLAPALGLTLGLLIGASTPIHAEWEWANNGVEVCTQPYEQILPQIVTDGAGGAIIVWQDGRNGSDDNIVAQRLNDFGEPVWPADGVFVCTAQGDQSSPQIAIDGHGGAFIAWLDARNNRSDVYAARLTSTGDRSPLWPDNGVAVAQFADASGLRSASDADGNLIVVWEQYGDIYAQKVNGLGESRWGQAGSGLRVSYTMASQFNPRILVTGQDDTYVVWEDRRLDYLTFVYAQKVSAEGSIEWQNDGIRVYPENTPQLEPRIIPGGQGVIVACTDRRYPDGITVAQSLGPDGSLAWNPPYGIEIGTGAYSFVMVDDDLGGAFFALQTPHTAIEPDVMAQRIDDSGLALWSRTVCAAQGNQAPVDIVSTGDSGAFIAWRDLRDWNVNGLDIYLQWVDSDGNSQWTTNGVSICSLSGDQSGAHLVAGGAGGVISAWQDARAGESDVYAQLVAEDIQLTLAQFLQFYPSGVLTDELLRISAVVRADDPDGVTTLYRPSGMSEFASLPMTEIEPSQYFAELPIDSLTSLRGIEYQVDVQKGPVSATSGLQRLRTVTANVQIPAPQLANAYDMLSIPLMMDGTMFGALTDDVGGLDETRWRMFTYDPAASSYLEVPSDDVRAFEAGRAYWMIVKEPTTLDTEPARAVSTPADGSFPIHLAPGWNQIANPFAFPVEWESVTVDTTVVSALHGWDPMTQKYLFPRHRIEPFEGYFIYNESGDSTTIWIPPVEADSESSRVSGRGRGEESIVEQQVGWQLELVASTGGGSDTVVVGARSSADDERDSFDVRKPPPAPASPVRIEISHPDWARPAQGEYWHDYRGLPSEGHIWELSIQTLRPRQRVELSAWGDAILPPGLSILLIDREQGVSSRIEPSDPQQARYTLLTSKSHESYRVAVIVGEETFVRERSERSTRVPQRLVLDQNEPNPFNPATRIRFGLPEPTIVNLLVYDLRGRKVTSLVEGVLLTAGLHTVIWNGTDSRGFRLASGVYTYALETASGLVTRKAVLLE